MLLCCCVVCVCLFGYVLVCVICLYVWYCVIACFVVCARVLACLCVGVLVRVFVFVVWGRCVCVV